MKLDVEIPENATRTVEISVTNEKVRMWESGKSIWNNGNSTKPNHSGIESISRDGDAVVDVGSGEYSFELEPIGK